MQRIARANEQGAYHIQGLTAIFDSVSTRLPTGAAFAGHRKNGADWNDKIANQKTT
jgi:hypothetical protein